MCLYVKCYFRQNYVFPLCFITRVVFSYYHGMLKLNFVFVYDDARVSFG